MSDTTDTTTATTEGEGGDNLKQLRKAAEDGRAARTEAETLRRENMFLKAGVDPEATRLHKMLFQTFQGDDIEALKAEARELGIKLPGDAPAPPTADPAVQQFQQTRDALNGGNGTPAGAAPQSTPDPIDAAYAKFYQDLNVGRPRDEAALEAMNSVLAAGASGDKRVIFDPVKWMQNAHPAVPTGVNR